MPSYTVPAIVNSLSSEPSWQTVHGWPGRWFGPGRTPLVSPPSAALRASTVGSAQALTAALSAKVKTNGMRALRLGIVGLVACSPANQNDAEYWSPSVVDPAAVDASVDETPPLKDCLRVEFTTVSYGGRYAPRNVGAVWITTEAGAFVKTLEEWGTRRHTNLYAWRKSSAGNTVDAITGATRSTAGAHTSTWNCSDGRKVLVPAGNYVVNAEFVENNVSSTGTGAGPGWKQTFTVGATPETLTPANDKAYLDKKIVFTP